MANITTCTRCGDLYEAGSEEQANEPVRLCPTCLRVIRDGVEVLDRLDDQETITGKRIAARMLRLELPVTAMFRLVEAHTTCCPMDLDRLLEAGEGDFVHDVLGVFQHFNPRTSTLNNCFRPRFAKRGG